MYIYIYIYLCRWFYLIYWCICFEKLGEMIEPGYWSHEGTSWCRGAVIDVFLFYHVLLCDLNLPEKLCFPRPMENWKTVGVHGVRFRRYRGWQIALQRKPCCFQVFRIQPGVSIQPIYGVYIYIYIYIYHIMDHISLCEMDVCSKYLQSLPSFGPCT